MNTGRLFGSTGAGSAFDGLGVMGVWRFREFIYCALLGEFKRHIARSRLGAIWLVLNPLFRAAIFGLVFSELLAVKLRNTDAPAAYAIYLMAGMCGWSLFNDVVSRASVIFLDYGRLMKRLPFPPLCLPAIALGYALFNHLVLVVATMAVLVALGHYPEPAWLSVAAGIALLSALACGIGTILGILNVFRRDVGHIAGIVLQIWFWLTPVVYAPSNLPARYAWVAQFNPLTPLVGIYQDALLYGTHPRLESLLAPALLAIFLSALALILLERARNDIVDAL